MTPKKIFMGRGASTPFHKYYAFYLKNYRKTIDFFGVQFFLFFKNISYQCLSKYSSFYLTYKPIVLLNTVECFKRN